MTCTIDNGAGSFEDCLCSPEFHAMTKLGGIGSGSFTAKKTAEEYGG